MYALTRVKNRIQFKSRDVNTERDMPLDTLSGIKKGNSLPRGSKWIYAECDMLS